MPRAARIKEILNKIVVNRTQWEDVWSLEPQMTQVLRERFEYFTL